MIQFGSLQPVLNWNQVKSYKIRDFNQKNALIPLTDSCGNFGPFCLHSLLHLHQCMWIVLIITGMTAAYKCGYTSQKE